MNLSPLCKSLGAEPVSHSNWALATLFRVNLSRHRPTRRVRDNTMALGAPRFPADIFQLITGMFHLSPDCHNVAAQFLNRAHNLLSKIP